VNEIPPDVPQPKACGLAANSLVLGIVAVVVCFAAPLFGLAAVIFGHLALSRIKKSGGALTGRKQAMAGLVLGYFSFALAAWAIPYFIKARDIAQANSCINHMVQIDSAVQQWALDNHKKETDAIDQNAVGAYLKPGIPVCPAGGLYTFGATVGTNPVVTCSVPGHRLH